MTNFKRRELLRKLYAAIPNINCQGRCYKSCGPILFSKAEEKLITNLHGTFPHPDATLTCNFLDTESHQCRIYEHRPMLCRLFGAANTSLLKCDYGCTPEVALTAEQVGKLLQLAASIEGDHTPRQRNALAKALREHKDISKLEAAANNIAVDNEMTDYIYSLGGKDGNIR